MRILGKAMVAATLWGWSASAILAQDAWLQIEAQPGLTRAEQAASRYAQRLQDVAGFRLGRSNWFAIVLGPYSPAEASSLRARLRSSGAIPGDAFVSDGANYTDRFWPIGATTPAPVADPAAPAGPSAAAPASPPATEVKPADQTVAEARASESLLLREERQEIQRQLRYEGFYNGAFDGAFGRGTRTAMAAWQSDRGFEATGVLTEGQRRQLAREYADRIARDGPPPETPAEARANEALLSRAERELVQTAMQWAGVYSGSIDGAFGRGTRASMAAWQREKGHEVTGVLTTRQRNQLIAEYNAILEGLGLAEVEDDTAGIRIIMPTELVRFAGYEPPFAQYNATSEGALHRVILISQRGNRNTLQGLYDIMQTLEIVPEDGPREESGNSFTLVGQNDEFISHTEARLVGDTVKGFTLIWPTGDEERRTRLLGEMRRSFDPIPGVVMEDLVASSGADQRIDLVSGLRIRRPELSRSGFFIDDRGTVLTTSDVLQECGKITLNDDVEAEVAATDEGSGLAMLTPKRDLAPLDHARFRGDIPRLQSEIAVAGYSFEGVLGAPSLTFGTLADIRGLDGADGVDRLELAPQPGDSGGPVLDSTGSVVGMLLPRTDEAGRVLPDGVAFSADVGAISAFLGANGLSPDTFARSRTMTTEEMTHMAANLTVLVSCWD